MGASNGGTDFQEIFDIRHVMDYEDSQSSQFATRSTVERDTGDEIQSLVFLRGKRNSREIDTATKSFKSLHLDDSQNCGREGKNNVEYPTKGKVLWQGAVLRSERSSQQMSEKLPKFQFSNTAAAQRHSRKLSLESDSDTEEIIRSSERVQRPFGKSSNFHRSRTQKVLKRDKGGPTVPPADFFSRSKTLKSLKETKRVGHVVTVDHRRKKNKRQGSSVLTKHNKKMKKPPGPTAPPTEHWENARKRPGPTKVLITKRKKNARKRPGPTSPALESYEYSLEEDSSSSGPQNGYKDPSLLRNIRHRSSKSYEEFSEDNSTSMWNSYNVIETVHGGSSSSNTMGNWRSQWDDERQIEGLGLFLDRKKRKSLPKGSSQDYRNLTYEKKVDKRDSIPYINKKRQSVGSVISNLSLAPLVNSRRQSSESGSSLREM